MVNAMMTITGILTTAIGAFMLVKELDLMTIPFEIPGVALAGIILALGVLGLYVGITDII